MTLIMASHIPTFEFSYIYIKLLYQSLAVLNIIIEIPLKGGAKNTLCVLNNPAYKVKYNSKVSSSQ